jgi:hypothetical protein
MIASLVLGRYQILLVRKGLKNGRVSITGRDEVVFSIVLFMLDLTLHPRAPAMTYVESVIKYFCDLGLPVDHWLFFDRITAASDTRLAWGTPTARIAFPMDDRDPGDGCEIINRGRGRQIWHSISSAVGCEANVAAPVGDEHAGNRRRFADRRCHVAGHGRSDRRSASRPALRQGQHRARTAGHFRNADKQPARRDPIRGVIELLEIAFKG